MRQRFAFRLVTLGVIVTAACGLGGLVFAVPTTASADAGLQETSWWRFWDHRSSRPTSHRSSTEARALPPAPASPRPVVPSAPAPVAVPPPTTTSSAPAAPAATTRSTAPATRSTAPATSSAPAAAPAGGASAAPAGDVGGWKQVFSDNFDGSSLGSQWRTYSGQPGGSPYGTWSPSQVQVNGGFLNLRNGLQNGQWVSGGLANRISQTYGKWEMRFRVDAGDEIKYAALLWPDGPSWPPEIDFAEDAGGNRSGTTATLHYGSNDAMVGEQVRVDLTQWHTMGVEWSPGTVVYTLDGRPWATTQHSGVPNESMHLAIQTQPGGCQGGGGSFGCGVGNPGATTMQVDWVTIYARA